MGHGAAGLRQVRAVTEPAGTDIGAEVREGKLQILLQNDLHPVRIEGGEAGRIGHIGGFVQAVQLHMAGGVPAPAQLVGDLSRLQPQLRQEAVENAALSHAGIAGEGGELAGNFPAQLLHPMACFGAGANHPEARPGIDFRQSLRRIQVHLVDAQDHRHLLISCDSRHPVNEEGLRHRVGVGGKDHQGVQIGYGRSYKAVLPGKELLHHALFTRYGDFRQVASERGQALLPEVAPGAAGHGAFRCLNLIKTAEGANDSACHPFTVKVSVTFWLPAAEKSTLKLST